MTGRERVCRAMAGQSVDHLPVLPIVHAGLPALFGVPLGEFFTRADTMAAVTERAYREFGYDGVQLSGGVTAEAEALGARVEQPPAGAPLLREHLLSDYAALADLRRRDPTTAGRMPLFYEAVRRVVSAIGAEAFVLATLRGPLLAATQLRGVEQTLVDSIDFPEELEALLEFTTDTALTLGRWLRGSGAHGLVLGEATCSPNFISPALYRRLVLPRHRRLVRGLKDAGWRAVGLHICGDTRPIIEDVVSTGVDFLDVDYQVPAAEAVALANGRMALRGNLDPGAVLRFGDPERVRRETEALLQALPAGSRWILSTGCDIPPGTPAANLAALVRAASHSPLRE